MKNKRILIGTVLSMLVFGAFAPVIQASIQNENPRIQVVEDDSEIPFPIRNYILIGNIVNCGFGTCPHTGLPTITMKPLYLYNAYWYRDPWGGIFPRRVRRFTIDGQWFTLIYNSYKGIITDTFICANFR